MLIGIDLETTGLDPREDVVLEVAMLALDDDLSELDHFHRVVRRDPGKLRMPRVVWDMHEASGLVEELPGGTDWKAVREQFASWLRWQNVAKPPALGSTVSFDRSFLREHAPELDAALHYRSVDVSSVKELARRWRPDLPPFEAPAGLVQHRALDDIRHSVAELRYYREHFFRSKEAA